MTTNPATDVLLGARYRLVSLIAAGGMGEVWSATDEVLGRNVAVKVLRRELADDPTFRQRFRAEARHTAALSHAGIAAVYDYRDGSTADGVAAESPFLVMENVPGEPLSALLERDGALPYDRTLDVIAQAALALQAAHDAGVIHRDIKPGNMLLTPAGNVKITDFGISRAVNSAPLTATGDIMGTAFYLSPEQASGQSVTPASDVYSLGVVAYECLTGHRPFDGDTPVSVALAHVRDQPAALGSDVPSAGAALVLRMLAKNPAGRPSSAAEIAREALALRAGLVPPLAATSILAATSVLAATDVSPGVAPASEVTVALPVLTRSTAGHGSATDPGFQLPVIRDARRWLPYAVGIVAGALVLLFVVHSFGNDAGAKPAATPKAQTAPATVLVRASDYLGKPATDASAALRALGLTVALRPAAAGTGAPIGSVTAVTPTGRLDPAQTVTLEVAQAPAAPVSKSGKHDGQSSSGHGPGQKKKDDRKQGKP